MTNGSFGVGCWFSNGFKMISVSLVKLFVSVRAALVVVGLCVALKHLTPHQRATSGCAHGGRWAASEDLTAPHPHVVIGESSDLRGRRTEQMIQASFDPPSLLLGEHPDLLGLVGPGSGSVGTSITQLLCYTWG